MRDAEFDSKLLSVDNNSHSDSEILITPNPTSGIFTVKGTPENTLNVSVLNILGESVMEIVNTHSGQFSIDLSKHVSGVYYLKFISSVSVFTKMIVLE